MRAERCGTPYRRPHHSSSHGRRRAPADLVNNQIVPDRKAAKARVHGCLLILFFPRLAARPTLNVENLYRIVGVTIEHFVWISNEGCRAHTRSIHDLLCALRPSTDSFEESVQSFFKCQRDGRIIPSYETENLVEIAKRVLGKDDFHPRRCLAKTASTSASVANRPSLAALRPRSMPSSSSRVARYTPSRTLASISSAIAASSAWASSGHVSARSITSFSTFMVMAPMLAY